MKNNSTLEHKIVGVGLIVVTMFAAAAAEATQRGFYIGGAVGESEFDDIGDLAEACAVAGVTCGTDDTDTGVKVFGGYQFGNYLAFEGGYVDLGTLEAGVDAPVLAVASFDMNGGFLSLVPQIPIGDIGAVYGRAGIVAGDAELTARAPAFAFDESDSGTVAGFNFGFGGALHFGRLTIRVEWERYSFDEAFTIAGVDIDAPDIDLITGSALVRF